MLRGGLKLTGAVVCTGVSALTAVYQRERRYAPPGSELVCAPSSAQAAADVSITLKRLSADNLMGGYDAYYLAATYACRASNSGLTGGVPLCLMHCSQALHFNPCVWTAGSTTAHWTRMPSRRRSWQP